MTLAAPVANSDFALAPQTTEAVMGAVASASARLAIPVVSSVFCISLSTDAWVKFGTSTVDATANLAGNTLLLAGLYYFKWPYHPTTTHLAFIRHTADGVICITPLL